MFFEGAVINRERIAMARVRYVSTGRTVKKITIDPCKWLFKSKDRSASAQLNLIT